MDIRDSQRIKEIRDNTRAMAEAFGRIADTLAEALELYISTQIETQNSNLTFEKDECAKEYEELGLKELKELINADRKDENCSEIPNNCEDDFFREPTAKERKAVADYIDSISVPTGVNVFDLMDEPQKHCHRPNNVACHPEQGDMWCRGCGYWYANEPRTERSE